MHSTQGTLHLLRITAVDFEDLINMKRRRGIGATSADDPNPWTLYSEP
jgi:hypothetical protein